MRLVRAVTGWRIRLRVDPPVWPSTCPPCCPPKASLRRFPPLACTSLPAPSALERCSQGAPKDLLFFLSVEKLAALVPLPHVHLVRYGGCLAPHSHLRGAILPTPRQQGLDGEEPHTGTPYWPWARLLGRVFGLEMRTCPFCRRGSLHIIAVITQESVITRILRHLQLASVPPPIAPARYRQACAVFD